MADESNAFDLSNLSTPDLPAEELTNLTPLAGIGMQLVTIVTDEGSSLGLVIELVAPDHTVARYIAPASGGKHIQAALNDVRSDLRKATTGEPVEIPTLVLGGGE